jgi:hypothetical protein
MLSDASGSSLSRSSIAEEGSVVGADAQACLVCFAG